MSNNNEQKNVNLKLPPSKRRNLTIIVVFLWLLMGILGFIEDINLNNMAAYYVSLTGFIGTYMWSETSKQSKDNTNFCRPKSYREKIIYMVVVVWLLAGLGAIYTDTSLTGTSAYFGSLTPFISSYMISITYKSENNKNINE